MSQRSAARRARAYSALVIASALATVPLVPVTPAWANWDEGSSLTLSNFSPTGGVFSADASQYFMTGSAGGNQIRVVDIPSLSVSRSVNVTDREVSPFLNSDATTLWVVRPGEDEVAARSATDTSLTELGSASVGNYPWDVTLTASENYALVGSGLGGDPTGTVTVIDTADYSVVASVNVGKVPDSLETVGDNDLYVVNTGADGNTDRLTKLDISNPSSPTEVWNVDISGARHVTASPDGQELWVASGSSGGITVVTPDGQISRTIDLDSSDTIAFSSTRGVSVIANFDSGAPAVYEVDTSSGSTTKTISREETAWEGYLEGLSLSADGQRLAFALDGPYGSSDSTLYLYEFVSPENSSDTETSRDEGDIRWADAAIHLDPGITVGSAVESARVLAEGRGLARGEPWKLIISPLNIVLESGEASRAGNFSSTSLWPTSLPAGQFVLQLRTQDPAGNPLILRQEFAIDTTGAFQRPGVAEVTEIAPSEQSTPEVSGAQASEQADPKLDQSSATSDAGSAAGTAANPASDGSDGPAQTAPAEMPSDPQQLIPSWLLIGAVLILAAAVAGSVLMSRRRAPRRNP